MHLICLHIEFVFLPVLCFSAPPSLSFSLLFHPKAPYLLFLFFAALIYMAEQTELKSKNEKRAMQNKSIYAHNQKIHIACTLIYDIKCNNFEVFLFASSFFPLACMFEFCLCPPFPSIYLLSLALVCLFFYVSLARWTPMLASSNLINLNLFSTAN